MNVLLLKYVKGLGQPGQVVNVGDAYARNFLLPKKVAALATPDKLSQVKQQAEQKMRRVEHAAADQQAAIERLTGTTIRFVRPGIPDKHLYVGLKAADIAAEVHRQYGFTVDRTSMNPPVIKSTGPTAVTLTWPDRKTTTITVIVEAKT